MTYVTDKYKKARNWRVSKEANAPQKYHTFGFSKVEKMFYYYPKIKAAVEEERANRATFISAHKDGDGSSTRPFHSDPTYQMAVKRIGDVDSVRIISDGNDSSVVVDPEKWIAVVEQTLKKFGENDTIGGILRKRYLSNEPMPKTCIRYELTYSKYYRNRDIGINYARECAIQLGLIKVF